MRRLTRGTIREACNILTLMRARAAGGGAGGVAVPQPTAQNQALIANATPAWSLLAAPTGEFQVPIAGADPYTPAWAVLTVETISDLAYATPALTLSTSNVEGSADTVIRSDATILVFDATVPNTIEPDDTAVIGTATVAARRDHEHAIVCAAPADPSVSLAASTEGTGTSFARADHAHQLDQAIAPTWTALHTFTGGVYLVGASEAMRTLTVLDTAAPAMRLLDTGATEYLRIISTDAQPAVVFNEGGADIDFRVEGVGQPNALFVEGSTGNTGTRTNAPAAPHHVLGGTVSNKHLSAYRTQVLERGNVALQLIATDISVGMAHVVLTGAPASGDNKHWVISHKGVDAANRFTIAYMTSSADDFLPQDATGYFRITTGGDVDIWENGAWIRLSGTIPMQFGIGEPIVEAFGQWRLPWACTVKRVDGNVIGGTSATFNVEERTTLGSSGTNVLSSDMVADVNGESVTGGFNNSALAAGSYLTIDVSAVSGTVNCLSITLTVTID